MYEYIKGELVEMDSTHAVIETGGGVGYYINISLQSYTELEGKQTAKLFVHFIVREDAQILYGFTTKQERDIFRLLLGVSGVGGNTARMILSTYTCADLSSIISSGNDTLLKNVKGLGVKTAQKIIVELKDKIFSVADTGVQKISGSDQTLINEAVSALTMLGFAKNLSIKAVNNVLKENPSLGVEQVIRQALKLL